MIKSCAKNVTSFLISNDALSSDDYETYSYGFEILISFIVNISAILLAGFLFNKFGQTLIFLGCYSTIRQFTGGYHEDSYRRCLLTFITIFIANIYIIEKIVYMKFDVMFIIIACISSIGIFYLAPVEHRNNPLSDKEKKHHKRTAIILVSLVLLISIIGINFETVHDYALYSASSLTLIFIMLNLALIKKGVRGEK